MTTERVKVELGSNTKPISFLKTLLATFTNRALLAIIAAAIFLLLSQLIVQTINNYLFADYFNNTLPLSAASFLSTALSLIIAVFTVPLSKKYRKKEVSIAGTLFTGIVYLILFFLKIKNPWLFVVLSSIGFVGISFFNMIIWANITDVIDYQEVKTGHREDGIVYSVYSFARKVGQALAGGATGWALSAIGYSEISPAQTIEVANRIYIIDTLIPSLLFFVVAAILLFLYPLNKKAVEENTNILKERHNQIK